MERDVTAQRSIGIPVLMVALAAAVFFLLNPAPALAGGSSQWSPQGGSSWPAQNPPTVPDAQDLAVVRPQPEREPAAAQAVPAVNLSGIVFPVAGTASYTDSYGAPRPGGRTHEGIDIFAEKMTPVVAVADGTVSFVRNGVGTDCCVLRVQHDDGRSSLYLHLNNDTPGTDDGLGYGVAEGIEVGIRINAGQVIGYVGDSGNAEETSPHLHIELSDPGGNLLNPYAYLQVAQGADPALFAAAAQTETLPATGLPVTSLLQSSVALLLAGGALAVFRRGGRLT